MKIGLSALVFFLFALFSSCGKNDIDNASKVSYESSSIVSTGSSSSFSKSSSTETTSSTEKGLTIDIAGTYYTQAGETAEIKEIAPNSWEISYTTSEGKATAMFKTNWKENEQGYKSNTDMKKSDGYMDFNIVITYINSSDITINMTDGNPDYQMTFTKNKPSLDETYSGVLKGDLSSFAGKLTTDQLNQAIADSGFTMGGYKPEDYYQNKTTAFPAITENGYWNGITSHGNYEVEQDDLPILENGYYKVNVHGTNYGAGAYDENNPKSRMQTFYLVPPNVLAPDGTTKKEKRVFQEDYEGKIVEQQYLKDNWWNDYQN